MHKQILPQKQHPHVSQCALAHEQHWRSTKLSNPPTHPINRTPPPLGGYVHFSQDRGKPRQTHPPSLRPPPPPRYSINQPLSKGLHWIPFECLLIFQSPGHNTTKPVDIPCYRLNAPPLQPSPSPPHMPLWPTLPPKLFQTSCITVHALSCPYSVIMPMPCGNGMEIYTWVSGYTAELPNNGPQLESRWKS